MLFWMSFFNASMSNWGGEEVLVSCCFVLFVLVVLVVCSVVTELLVDELSLLRVFLVVITGKSFGSKRNCLFVLRIGGLLNCLLLSF